jgi:CubicO group peptidase (beta-lactamase class C family)
MGAGSERRRSSGRRGSPGRRPAWPALLLLLVVCLLASLSVVATALATPLPASDARRVGDNPALDRALRAIVHNPERPLSGLSVLTVQDGRVTYTGTFGFRYIDSADPRNNLRVTPRTKFRIASISKLVTAIGVMQQVEQGAIDLDADVSTYLGFPFRNPSYPDTPITVRMLLSHTSSVRDGDRYVLPPTQPLSDFFLPDGAAWDDGSHWASPDSTTPDVAPGHYFCYANLNYGVLATILERVTGERFDRYMEKHVLVPLGCEASYNVRRFSTEALRHVATLYRKRSPEGVWDPTGPWYPQVDDYRGVRPPAPEGAASYVPGTNATWQGPQGGLRISAWDLSKVMRMFLNGGRFNGVRILKRSTVNLMFTPHWTYCDLQPNGDTYWDLMLCYGLGPHIITNRLGDRLLADRPVNWAGHLGEAYGLLSGMMMDFGTRSGFIYLIGGVGDDPDAHFGDYSTFYKWEEEIMTQLFRKQLLR